jgi:N-acetylmuramoyl-L-alanine amidase
VVELNRRDMLEGAAVATAGSLTTLSGAGTASAATHPTLQVGSHGSAVLALQTRLTSLGYWLGEVDGQFGDLTRQAVVAVQKVAGLSPMASAGLSRGHEQMGAYDPVPVRPQAMLSRS